MTSRTALEHHQHQAGFTLLELLVVAGLSIIIMIGATSLLFTSLVTSSRKETLTTIKQEGDYALGQMEFLLRNATKLVVDPADASSPPPATCTAGMNSISFRSRDASVTTLEISGGKIASRSGANTVFLTSSAVNATPVGGLFDCQSAVNAGEYITLHFGLTSIISEDNSSLKEQQPLQETFTTSVNVRSH